MRIAQVNTADRGGGAERNVAQLHAAYRSRGHHATLYVGRRRGDIPGTVQLRNGAGLWGVHDRLRDEGSPRAARVVRALAAPGTVVDTLRGREDFAYPGTRSLLERAGDHDVLQLHNLHGGYFDLRVLPELSARTRVVLSPHDAWLVTGHVAHSLECDRWRTGCGSCPHLRVYPALLVDGSAANWRRKAELYRRSKVRVAVPCRWLADVVADSMLAPAVEELRVIPNGVDIASFTRRDRQEARAHLGVPEGSRLVVFTAVGGRVNIFKDAETIERALEALGATTGDPVTAVVLGGPAEEEQRLGRVAVRFPGEVDYARVADWLAAADLYLHAAHADTFPLTILEALACGTPVVATAVGGIPEQLTDETGVLVPHADAAALAEAAGRLLADDSRRAAMSAAASADAAKRFDASLQADRYLEWFEELAC